jgi:hypothetical protein
MFGLTYREQRWKAEQKLAELLAPLVRLAIENGAAIRIAESQADANELAALREENARLKLQTKQQEIQNG